MGRIQSSVGLITGVPIADTVEQLLKISARPRNLLVQQTESLQQQQLAITELTALVVGVQLAVRKLDQTGVFDEKSVTSSNEALLAARLTGDPALGIYQFTPIRTAQNHQLMSRGVSGLEVPLGAGAFRVRFGGFVDEAVRLELLNAGQGVERGQIRITDRSGASAVVDLRFAQSIGDVVEAINRQPVINVTAQADGDRLRLVDQTGLSLSNLRVQEISGGRTAADLGLAGIDVANSVALGQDVVRLYESLDLKRLNDGSGVILQAGLADLQVTFGDGSALEVDFAEGDNAPQTLGDILDALNAADPARLQARISSDGDRLELLDLTSGAGRLSVTSLFGGTAAEDLGLTTTSGTGLLEGRRLLGGLDSPLLASLAGGRGLGELGLLQLTDRAGQSATVDLASAETLAAVIAAINSADVAITARVNDARNGIRLEDTSGSTANPLLAASGDATRTAEKLGLAASVSGSSIDSGSLDRQTLHENVLLSSLHGGRGVAQGSFLITDSAGGRAGVNLVVSQAKTVGDVIRIINSLSIGVEARINDQGDGILLVDTARGTGKLAVTEAGSGRTAADLRLAGVSTTVDLNGTPTQAIDGSTTLAVELDADDTLADLVEKLNALDAGVQASVVQDGSATAAFRLSLVSQVSGKSGELMVDDGALDLGFRELAAAQDALLLLGNPDSPGAGILASSAANEFDQIVEGLTLTVNGASPTPVSISVGSTDGKLVSSVKLWVDQYNKLQDKLGSLTFFNETDQTTGLLFGSLETLRLESDLARLLTNRFLGVGPVQSLEQIGVSIGDDGRLSLDETKLKAKFRENAGAIEEFFMNDASGFVARLDAVIDTLAGEGNSLLLSRQQALQQNIDNAKLRVLVLDERLERERERLTKEFYDLELAIGKLQSNLNALNVLRSISGLATTTTGKN